MIELYVLIQGIKRYMRVIIIPQLVTWRWWPVQLDCEAFSCRLEVNLVVVLSSACTALVGILFSEDKPWWSP